MNVYISYVYNTAPMILPMHILLSIYSHIHILYSYTHIPPQPHSHIYATCIYQPHKCIYSYTYMHRYRDYGGRDRTDHTGADFGRNRCTTQY